MQDTARTTSAAPYRIASVDFYRGLCLVLIMLTHTLSWYGLDPRGGAGKEGAWSSLPIDKKIAGYLNGLPTGAPGFVILVGVMMGLSYFPRLRDQASVRRTIKRLATRIGELILIIYGFSIAFYILFRTPGPGMSAATPDKYRSLSSLLEVLTLQG